MENKAQGGTKRFSLSRIAQTSKPTAVLYCAYDAREAIRIAATQYQPRHRCLASALALCIAMPASSTPPRNQVVLDPACSSTLGQTFYPRKSMVPRPVRERCCSAQAFPTQGPACRTLLLKIYSRRGIVAASLGGPPTCSVMPTSPRAARFTQACTTYRETGPHRRGEPTHTRSEGPVQAPNWAPNAESGALIAFWELDPLTRCLEARQMPNCANHGGRCGRWREVDEVDRLRGKGGEAGLLSISACGKIPRWFPRPIVQRGGRSETARGKSGVSDKFQTSWAAGMLLNVGSWRAPAQAMTVRRCPAGRLEVAACGGRSGAPWALDRNTSARHVKGASGGATITMPGKHVRFAAAEDAPSPSWSTKTIAPSPAWSTSTLASSPLPAAPPSLPHKLSPYGNSPLPPIEPELAEEYVAPNPNLCYSLTPSIYFNVAHDPAVALQRMDPEIATMPATYPALSRLTLVHHQLPWRIVVTPRSTRPNAPVTIGDIVVALAEALTKPAEEAELQRETPARRVKITEAWKARWRRHEDSYVRRIDWLEGYTIFMGMTATQQHGVWAFHMGH
uniref:DUF6699 domain-containing protein n=1 Tax=Schizophyllum commune (strain H4-8 / FGSC 9210) TaxID=578458 RepID=D8QCC3_SCHCM